MKIKPILRWLLIIGTFVIASGIVRAGEWMGDYRTNGFWEGVISYKFDGAWLESERKVVREAFSRYMDLDTSEVVFKEVSEDADIVLRWDDIMNYVPPHELPKVVSGKFDPGTIGAQITVEGEVFARPNGIVFNSFANESWYVDPDPTTDEAIPADHWDLYSVALHEIGHVLGFHHNPFDSIMNNNWGVGERRNITSTDEYYLAARYPLSDPAAADAPMLPIPEWNCPEPDHVDPCLINTWEANMTQLSIPGQTEIVGSRRITFDENGVVWIEDDIEVYQESILYLMDIDVVIAACYDIVVSELIPNTKTLTNTVVFSEGEITSTFVGDEADQEGKVSHISGGVGSSIIVAGNYECSSAWLVIDSEEKHFSTTTRITYSPSLR